MLYKSAQYFLLLLLLMYNLERKDVSIGYISTIMEQEKNNKMTLNLLESIKNKNITTHWLC